MSDISNSISKLLSRYFFYENFVVLKKVLTKVKKKNFYNFFRKHRYIRTKFALNQDFEQGIQPKNYLLFQIKQSRMKGIRLDSLKLLLSLLIKLKTVGKKICFDFSSQFVGGEASFLVNIYLETYLKIYKIWAEAEMWHFFDKHLSFRTRSRLMKFFWLKDFTQLRKNSNLWERVFGVMQRPVNPFLKEYGYSMRGLNLNDSLFFWHAFTRKKIQQNFLVMRGRSFLNLVLGLKRNVKDISLVTGSLFNCDCLNKLSFSFMVRSVIFKERFFDRKFVGVFDKFVGLILVFNSNLNIYRSWFEIFSLVVMQFMRELTFSFGFLFRILNFFFDFFLVLSFFLKYFISYNFSKVFLIHNFLFKNFHLFFMSVNFKLNKNVFLKGLRRLGFEGSAL